MIDDFSFINDRRLKHLLDTKFVDFKGIYQIETWKKLQDLRDS